MNSKYIIGLLLLFSAACSSPLTEEQKNADAVYLKQVKEYTLNSDGSSSYHYYHKMLYNSYLAINRFYGETFVVYNPEFQTLKVNKSVTRMADGKMVKSPDNAFNEVLPFAAADAPDYNHLREMVITHVGLERGAVVELDYVIQTKPGFVPFLADKINLCESSPVKEVEVIVRVPKGEKLNSNIINQPTDLKQSKSARGEYDVYSWKANNLRAFSHEPVQAEGLADYAALTFSTADFAASFEYLKGNLKNTFTPDESAKKLMNADVKGWDKVEQIHNYVVMSINTYGVTPQNTGYRFRSPEAVWRTNGGTEGEKVILLTEMLKQAGFNAQPVLAGYAHFMNKEVGYPGAFDKYLVKVDYEGETKYLSAVEEHSKVPGQRITIALADDISNISFEKAAKQNFKLGLNADFTISIDGVIKGIAKVNLSSFDNDKGLLNGISTESYSSTKSTDLKDSLVYDVKLVRDINAMKEDSYFIYTLPNIAQGIASISIGDLPLERTTSIDLPGTYNESYSFSFKLPKGLKVISPVNETIIENGLGKCSISGVVKDDSFIITRNIALNQAVIAINDYTNFRQLMTIWVDKNLNKVVFKVE